VRARALSADARVMGLQVLARSGEAVVRMRGPEGQQLSYKRHGSCCGFKDPSLPFGGGMLDMYEVTYEGLEEPATLYLDMYRREEPRAPSGFRLD
jgi:hypothetical protein